jgi:hypothetical protein
MVGTHANGVRLVIIEKLARDLMVQGPWRSTRKLRSY